jgi:hypothetical protein
MSLEGTFFSVYFGHLVIGSCVVLEFVNLTAHNQMSQWRFVTFDHSGHLVIEELYATELRL